MSHSLKTPARQLNINYEKEASLDEMARMYGVDIAGLQEIYNEVAREINAGNDSVLVTKGANVSPMVTAVSDPTPTYMVNLQTASARNGYSIKNTGWHANRVKEPVPKIRSISNARCQSRRESELSFEIEDFIDHLINIKVLEPIGEKTVVWDDLNEQSSIDKLDSAEKMSRINQAALATGEPVFSVEEIRTAAGYEMIVKSH